MLGHLQPSVPAMVEAFGIALDLHSVSKHAGVVFKWRYGSQSKPPVVTGKVVSSDCPPSSTAKRSANEHEAVANVAMAIPVFTARNCPGGGSSWHAKDLELADA